MYKLTLGPYTFKFINDCLCYHKEYRKMQNMANKMREIAPDTEFRDTVFSKSVHTGTWKAHYDDACVKYLTDLIDHMKQNVGSLTVIDSLTIDVDDDFHTALGLAIDDIISVTEMFKERGDLPAVMENIFTDDFIPLCKEVADGFEKVS